MKTLFLYINKQIGYVIIQAETARRLKQANLIKIEEEYDTSIFFKPKKQNINNKTP